MEKYKLSKDDVLELEGEVIESNKGIFRVATNAGEILCQLSGKIKMSGVKVLVGDKVKLESSIYNPRLGRITFRIKK